MGTPPAPYSKPICVAVLFASRQSARVRVFLAVRAIMPRALYPQAACFILRHRTPLPYRSLCYQQVPHPGDPELRRIRDLGWAERGGPSMV